MNDSTAVMVMFILLMLSTWLPRESDKTQELHDLLIEVCEKENALKKGQYCAVIAVVKDSTNE